MNRALVAACAVIVSLASCKEHDPLITLTLPNVVDTNYTGPAVTAQAHNVMIEEFTGASCSNCPAGHVILDGIISANSGKINAIAIHPNDFIQSEPYKNAQFAARYDFRTQQGADIENRIYTPLIFMPCAGIDRVPYNSVILSDRASWPGAVATRLTGASTPVNITLTSSYTTADSMAHVGVMIAFPQASANGQKISVVIVEDSLYDLQEDKTTFDQNYLFNNIFRQFVNNTTYNGDDVLPAVKVAGTVDIKAYTGKINTVWDPTKCRVIAYVTDATTKGGFAVGAMQISWALDQANCK